MSTMGWRWTGAERPPFADEPGPGQESVWDFPRPPRVEAATRPVRVEHEGLPIAESSRALRVLETAGAPVYYVPPDDVRLDLLEESTSRSACEWKGTAVYCDLVHEDGRVRRAAWTYPDPRAEFEAIRDHFGFYASKLDCFVGDERVRPQAGRFYGGWITSNLAGPIKGEPGTHGW